MITDIYLYMKNWTGIKLHHFTFLRPTDRRYNKAIVWEAQCDCGNQNIIDVVPCSIKHDGKKSCGCAKLANDILFGQRGRIYDPIISSARKVWSTYTKNGKSGDITFDEFMYLTQLPCHYCKKLPSKKYNVALSKVYRTDYKSLPHVADGYFIYNGLDRIDSNIKEHTLANIVPCCWICNRMKMNMNYYDFISQIKSIYEHIVNDDNFPNFKHIDYVKLLRPHI